MLLILLHLYIEELQCSGSNLSPAGQDFNNPLFPSLYPSSLRFFLNNILSFLNLKLSIKKPESKTLKSFMELIINIFPSKELFRTEP